MLVNEKREGTWVPARNDDDDDDVDERIAAFYSVADAYTQAVMPSVECLVELLRSRLPLQPPLPPPAAAGPATTTQAAGRPLHGARARELAYST